MDTCTALSRSPAIRRSNETTSAQTRRALDCPRAGALENYFRHDAALPPPDRELVILATVQGKRAKLSDRRVPERELTHRKGPRLRSTGRPSRDPKAVACHEIRGREVGVRDEAIEAVRANGSLENLTARERLLVEIVRSLLRDHRLAEELFSRGLTELGSEELVETVALMGHYTVIGSVANAFEVAAPEGSRTF